MYEWSVWHPGDRAETLEALCSVVLVCFFLLQVSRSEEFAPVKNAAG